MVGTARFFQWSAKKKKSFQLSSHNFISILGIINCINELKSATFLPPHFSRVPLHRQFLQKSTKICSSIFVSEFIQENQTNSSSQCEKHRLHEPQKNESQCWDLHWRAVWSCCRGQQAFSRWKLTMMALTMSLLLFFRARTAFARDTLACDMTSSMSLTSTPVSST